ncbi:MAG: hypothetical protein ACOYL6_08925 [Bacteriovoracaceae bacterium]
MKHIFFTILFSLITLGAQAAAHQSFLVDGSQNLLNIDLGTDVYRTEYRTEEYEDTCYKNWNENREICENVPRQSCQPGPQVCQNVPKQSCKDGPQICENVPVQQCHYGPEVCQMVDKQQCHKAPPVCRNVCHKSPDGSEICKQVCSEGGNICETVQAKQCRPGENQCKTVYENKCRPGPQVCSTYYQNECHAGPQVCRTYMNYECRTAVISHSDPYSCTKSRQVPYEVLDHHTNARATIAIGKVPKGVKLNEMFDLSIVNDDLILTVKSSKQVLISSTKTSKVSTSGVNKNIEANYVLAFSDITELKEALTDITNVTLSNNTLAYTIGAATDVKFKHTVKLVQDRFIGKKTILDRLLTDNEVQSMIDNGKQRYFIELVHLDIIIKERTHFAKIRIEPNLDAYTNVLNKEDIMGLSLVKEQKIKL